MSWSAEKARRPEIIMAEMIKSAAIGHVDRHMHRALVLAYDARGGQLQNPNGSGFITVKTKSGEKKYKALAGPTNPPSSIKARIITDSIDSLHEDDDVRVFWPLMEHSTALPDEHVMVMFEDAHRENGLWLVRVPNHVGQNHAPGADSYDLSIESNPTAVSLFIEEPLGYQPDDSEETPLSDATRFFNGR